MKTIFFIILVACVITKSAELFRLQIIENAKEKLALCNDQTPAGFYYRSGSTNNWVIRLQGGGWCWDLKTCEDRLKYSPHWMTNKYCPEAMNDTYLIAGVPHGGILSSNKTINPFFYDANHIYVWYCSSDSHLGTKGPSSELNNWVFYGKHIIKAIMDDLVVLDDNKFKLAENVLITGDSAGGVGTINNIDWMVNYLRPHVPKLTKFRGFVDAGWFIDLDTYQNSTTPFREVSKALLSTANVVYDESCVNAFKDKGEEWKCLHLQYLYPYLTTPVFCSEFLYDSANLGFDGVNKPFDPPKLQFISNFRAAMSAQLASINQLFAAACYKHEVEDSDLFASVTIQGKNIAGSLGEWFFNNVAGRYVDTCDSLDCNPSCN